MQTLDHDEVTVHVDAPRDVVYALVADVTRTPDFSPEVISCTWLDGATEPAVGVRFEAVNKVPRRPPWRNRPVIIAAEPGREFAFSRTERFAGTLVWRYRFEPEGAGTLVSEAYAVTQPLTRIGWFIIGTMFGRRNRRSDLKIGMKATLERLKAAAERESRDPVSRTNAGTA
jgi:Polyketide cyclase / dehydrase and lipid transport